MFLTNMSESRDARILSLEKLANLLPSPLRPLHGKRAAPLALPDNIICFCRRTATDLNRPQRGRALHHRFVLILALETAVTVAVDDRAIRLKAEEGLLVLPFQFHDYIQPAREDLRWLFITFDTIDAVPLQPLRFRPFVLTPVVRQTCAELVEAYLTRGEGDLTSLLLSVLLAADPAGRADPKAPPQAPCRAGAHHAGEPDRAEQRGPVEREGDRAFPRDKREPPAGALSRLLRRQPRAAPQAASP